MSVTTPDPHGVRRINAVPWSHHVGHDQGQVREGLISILTIGGQRPVDAEGRLMHENDPAAQAALALDNLLDVVAAAGMTSADLAHLRVYTTGLAALVDAQFVVDEHLAEHGLATPITTVAVSGLAIAGMDVEIDGFAVRTNHRPEGKAT